MRFNQNPVAVSRQLDGGGMRWSVWILSKLGWGDDEEERAGGGRVLMRTSTKPQRGSRRPGGPGQPRGGIPDLPQLQPGSPTPQNPDSPSAGELYHSPFLSLLLLFLFPQRRWSAFKGAWCSFCTAVHISQSLDGIFTQFCSDIHDLQWMNPKTWVIMWSSATTRPNLHLHK